MPFALQLLMILGRLTLCAKYHELYIITIIVYNRYNLGLLCIMRRLETGSHCGVEEILPVHMFPICIFFKKKSALCIPAFISTVTLASRNLSLKPRAGLQNHPYSPFTFSPFLGHTNAQAHF